MTLPHGLKPYGPGDFERLHAPGARVITASQVPALTGHDPRAGAYAVIGHAIGVVPHDVEESVRMQYGRILEGPAIDLLNASGIIRAKQVRAYAECPSLPRFLASVDGLVSHEDVDALDDETIGTLEVKTVAPEVFDTRWLAPETLDERPHPSLASKVLVGVASWDEVLDRNLVPPHVLVQAQAQFATKPACRFGAVLCIVAGTHRLEFHLYHTRPDPGVIEGIVGVVRNALEWVDADDLPDPRTPLDLPPFDRLGLAAKTQAEPQPLEDPTFWQDVQDWQRLKEIAARAGDAAEAAKERIKLRLVRDKNFWAMPPEGVDGWPNGLVYRQEHRRLAAQPARVSTSGRLGPPTRDEVKDMERLRRYRQLPPTH